MEKKTNDQTSHSQSNQTSHSQKRRKNNRYIEFRNRDIVKLFNLLGFKIRLVGNPKYPNFIMDDNYKLPISVAGNSIIMYESFDNKDKKLQIELGKGKLEDENIKDIRKAVIESMVRIEKKNIFKIKLGESLFLHDFKYVNMGGEHIPKYPLFAICDPKIIYTEEHAQEIIDKLSGDGYSQLSIEYPPNKLQW